MDRLAFFINTLPSTEKKKANFKIFHSEKMGI